MTHGVRSIAFPAISCGIYGYPIPEAAHIAMRTVAGFLTGGRFDRTGDLRMFGQDVLGAYQVALIRERRTA